MLGQPRLDAGLLEQAADDRRAPVARAAAPSHVDTEAAVVQGPDRQPVRTRRSQVGCHASLIGNRPHPLKPPSPERQSAAVAFNEALNRRDLDALDRLMTDDHTFIDSDDNVLAGKEKVLKGWKRFFDAFPDYRNDWSTVTPTGGTLTAVGRSVCSTEPALGRSRDLDGQGRRRQGLRVARLRRHAGKPGPAGDRRGEC
jgi:ketosteroid isomerase-like protein